MYYLFRNLLSHGKTNKPFYKNLMPYDWYDKSNLIEGFLHVNDLWGTNSIESYEIYTPEYPIPKYASDEICEDGYLDYFRVTCLEKKIDYNKITHIKIDYIDRGITSFKTFGNMLKSLFPNLKSLDFSQNFTFHPLYQHNQNIRNIEYNDFLHMLKILQLDNFRLTDEQSAFFKLFSIDDIFEVMPENSLFVLTYKCAFGDEITKLTNNNLKKFYEKRSSKEIYIYN